VPKLSFSAAGEAMPAEGRSRTRHRFFEIAGKASAVAAATERGDDRTELCHYRLDAR
jgi:hypothetical protein